MADFVTLDDLKAALGVVDTSLDTELSTAINASTDMILDFLNRDPRATDYVERVDGRGSCELLVNQYPITAVYSVAIDGQPPLTPDQIDYDDLFIWMIPRRPFPRGRKNVTVVYNAGLDPLPGTLQRAAIYTVRALLTSKKVDLNSTGESWAGVTSQTWNPGGPGVVPVAAQTLLRNYQRRLSL